MLLPSLVHAAGAAESAAADFVVLTAGVADVTAYRPRSWGVLDVLPFGQFPAAAVDTVTRSAERSVAHGAQEALTGRDSVGQRLSEHLVQALTSEGRGARFVATARNAAGAELALRRDQIPDGLSGRWIVDAAVPTLALVRRSGAYEFTGAFSYRVLNMRGQLVALTR